jgi:hypothetical protein
MQTESSMKNQENLRADPSCELDPKQLVVVCPHVFKNTKSIKLVVRQEGDWQFLCGGPHNEGEGPHIVGVGHLLNRDESLAQLMDLPEGWEAERRSIRSKWSRKSMNE